MLRRSFTPVAVTAIMTIIKTALLKNNNMTIILTALLKKNRMKIEMRTTQYRIRGGGGILINK